MPTFTAQTTLSDKSKADALAEVIELLDPEPTGVGVYEREDGSGLFEVCSYFTEPPDEIGLALLAAASDVRPFAVSELPETDWVAVVKRDLAPIIAGRFFLYGSHDADQVPEDCVALLIEAAMAFGTGHHGTTQGCLTALDNLANQGFVGHKVADIGCGTAVLAMAAAKIWPAVVMAGDIDEVATATASANVAGNGLTGRVEVVTCAGFDHVDLLDQAPYDLVFANILKGPLIDLAPDMGKYCARDGYVILSGILNEQADEVLDAYANCGFARAAPMVFGAWSTLCLLKQA